MYTVYKHTTPSGKVYIGITRQKPEHRWDNGKGYKGNKYFYRAIQKYGWDNIKHDIICQAPMSAAQAGAVEKSFIALYDSTNPDKGYNNSIGGECGFSGMNHSIEARRKISEANKGQIPWIKGKHLSDEARQKISEANKGTNNPFYGKHHSDETRRKISESKKGRPSPRKGAHLSSETRRKISESLKGANNPKYGKHLSAETRRKIGESNAKYVICVETGTLYSSCTEAAESIGVTNGAISMAARGMRKTAGGYHWSYAE